MEHIRSTWLVRASTSIRNMTSKLLGAANRRKDDATIDQEQQFILRLPPGPAMALRHDVQSGSLNLKDKLSLELAADSRHGKLTYGGYVFNAKLVDLPCIIESLKTTDRKSFYKTADICQMLLCSNDDEEIRRDEVDDSPKKKDKDKRFLWNHGICPPLKNCRKKRFRKVLKKKYQEQPDIEKEVKRLFRMDNEAIDIKWEIVVEEDKAESHSNNTLRDDLNDDSNLPTGQTKLADIFGEVSSSDEDDDGNSQDVLGSFSKDTLAEAKDYSFTLMHPIESMEAELQPHNLRKNLQEIDVELKELSFRRLQQESQLALLENSPLKEQLEHDLEKTIEDEKRKKQDYEILSAVLNQ